MPIKHDLSDLPDSLVEMATYLAPGEKIFLCFVGKDHLTGEVWSQESREIERAVNIAFKEPGQSAVVAYIPVGSSKMWHEEIAVGTYWRENWLITEIPKMYKLIRPEEATDERKQQFEQLVKQHKDEEAMKVWVQHLIRYDLCGKKLEDIDEVIKFRDEIPNW